MRDGAEQGGQGGVWSRERRDKCEKLFVVVSSTNLAAL